MRTSTLWRGRFHAVKELSPEDFDGLRKFQRVVFENAVAKGFYEREKIYGELVDQKYRDDVPVDFMQDVQKLLSSMNVAGEHGVSVGTKLMLVVSEAAEALEVYRKFKAQEGQTLASPVEVNGKPEGFGSELADIVIRVMDLCGALDIDLATELLRKHEYNITRSFQHGGKNV